MVSLKPVSRTTSFGLGFAVIQVNILKLKCTPYIVLTQSRLHLNAPHCVYIGIILRVSLLTSSPQIRIKEVLLLSTVPYISYSEITALLFIPLIEPGQCSTVNCPYRYNNSFDQTKGSSSLLKNKL